jgi:hypothetical protein
MHTPGKIMSALLPAVFACSGAYAQGMPAVANFTGPLLTPSPSTLPAGVVAIEPYLIHSSSSSSYDAHGRKQNKSSPSKQWQMVVPVFIGIADRLQAQITPGVVHASSADMRTSGGRMTDTSVRLQYLLQKTNEDGTKPAIAASVTHRFPTGAYDRLDANPLNGTGNGATINSVALIAQQYIWLSNGRPLRWRANISYSPSPSRVGVHGVSVYGTPRDFRGYARLGRALDAVAAIEYSIDPQWVLALDLAYNRDWETHLTGIQTDPMGTPRAVNRRDPARSVYSLAPGVEYNFNSRIGVIAGVHFSVAGRHSDAFVNPQVAVYMVL